MNIGIARRHQQLRRWRHHLNAIVAGGTKRLGICSLLLVMVLSACTNTAETQVVSADVVSALSGMANDGYARATEPMAFSFPKDHGAHPEYQAEWWYYTGNLESERGRRFGYQLTIFRSALTPAMVERASDFATNQVYMAHFAITDVANNRHESFERYSRGASGLAGAEGLPQYRAWLEDWRIEELAPGQYSLHAAAPTADGERFALDLRLEETRPAVFHGDAGLSQKGPEAGNANHYYSLIGLDTSGEVRVGDSTFIVSGLSWFDHEFGTRALSDGTIGWDWFSFQLDNGAALMFAQVRTREGTVLESFEGTFIFPDGTQEAIGAEDFELRVLDEWKSPITSISYPSGWSVTLPTYQTELTIQPQVRDQEMLTTFVYWEGAVDVQGQMDGEPVEGSGYVELTGYGANQPSTLQR